MFIFLQISVVQFYWIQEKEPLHMLPRIIIQLMSIFTLFIPSKVENGGMTGTACRYAPVELVGDRYTAGSFAEVEAGRTAGGRLFG